GEVAVGPSEHARGPHRRHRDGRPRQRHATSCRRRQLPWTSANMPYRNGSLVRSSVPAITSPAAKASARPDPSRATSAASTLVSPEGPTRIAPPRNRTTSTAPRHTPHTTHSTTTPPPTPT